MRNWNRLKRSPTFWGGSLFRSLGGCLLVHGKFCLTSLTYSTYLPRMQCNACKGVCMHVCWVRTYVGSSRSEIVVLWYWVAARSRLLGSGGLGRAAW
jgi:hypothetical protein